jgi:2-polyprenyl-3-methyl-5-hydroxy-6-metoxy-1,4-benzoquinol methylase
MRTVETSSSDSLEASVVEANIEFYREIAAKYDYYESCAWDPELQQMLDCDLNCIGDLLGKGSEVHCLDCGGGSGNLSLKMLERGWSVTVVDVSSEMLALLAGKARARGFHPRIVKDSITRFLADRDISYDLVTFSSVLHHLYSYLPVVDLAAGHISGGGVFYSNFDPVVPRHSALVRAMEILDTSAAKLSRDASDFLPGAWRRLRKLLIKPDQPHKRAIAGPGDLAEYHARSGIDDAQILNLLKKSGFSVLEHVRWTSGRTKLTKRINQRFHLMESFKIIAQLETFPTGGCGHKSARHLSLLRREYGNTDVEN